MDGLLKKIDMPVRIGYGIIENTNRITGISKKYEVWILKTWFILFEIGYIEVWGRA
jgi:hypothetical protein